MDALSAVSGSRSGIVAYTSRRAYDWHGDGRRHNGFGGVHGSGLRRCPRYDYRLHGYVHTGLYHRHWRVVSNYRDRSNQRHIIHV
jgi:hypothetical protein